MPVDHGLLISQTIPGGSAERAGIKSVSSDGTIGDILLSADGQKISDMDDLFRLLDKKQIGDTVNFEVYRGRQDDHCSGEADLDPGDGHDTDRRSVQ